MGNFNAGAIEANLTLGRSTWTRDLKKTKAEIEDLERRSITIGVDLDTDNAQVSMDNLELFLDDLDSKDYAPSVSLNIESAEETLARLEAQLDALDSRTVVVSADADIDNAMIQFDNLEAQMNLLEQDGITITADADIEKAVDQLAILEDFVVTVDSNDINIKADVDSLKAEAQLAILEGMVIGMDGETINIRADVDRSLSGLVSGGSGGGGSLGFMQILIMAIIGLAPILSVAIGAATAAVVAFAGALAGAAGAAAVLAGGLFILIKHYQDLAKLPGPVGDAAQAFADSLQNVKDAMNGIIPDIAVQGFGLLSDALDLLAKIIPTLVPLFNEVAKMLDGVVGSIGNFVDSAEYKQMLDFFGGFGVDMLHTFLNIFGNLILFFGRLFDAFAPFATKMMHGLEDLTAGWADWAKTLDQNQGFQHFLDNAAKYGPMVLDMLGSLLDALMAVGHALEPFAGPMIEGFTILFDAIANAPVGLLTALIGGFTGLFLAFKIGVPLVSGVVGAIEGVSGALEAMSLALGIGAGPILIIIAAIAAFVGMVIYMWHTSDKFRNAILDTWHAIQNTLGPIIQDIVDEVKKNWGPISAWFKGIWDDVKSIFENGATIIKQIVRAAMWIIRQIWQTVGKDLIRIGKGTFQVIGAVIKGFFDVARGIFQLISDVLTGKWGRLKDDLINIAKSLGRMLAGIFRGLINIFGGIWGAIWDAIKRAWNQGIQNAKNLWSNFRGWIGDQWNSLTNWVSGWGSRIRTATANMWDGLKDSFRNAINSVIGWWNNLNFSVDIPNKIPGLPDSFSINTPNVPYLARGAYLTEPTLNVAGEAGPEIVAPEPVLRQIVQEHSGSKIDYGRLAAAVAAALHEALRAIQFRIAPEDLQAILERAGAHVAIDAGTDPNEVVRRMTSALSFELRRLGFGGKANV